MRGGQGSRESFVSASLLLAVLALIFRIAIPSGYMVGTPGAGTGLPPLVICTGSGAMTVAADPAGAPAGGDHQKNPGQPGGSEHPCAFAAAAIGFEPPVLTDIAAPPAVADAPPPALPATQRPGQGLAAPPPPTTGPPSVI